MQEHDFYVHDHGRDQLSPVQLAFADNARIKLREAAEALEAYEAAMDGPGSSIEEHFEFSTVVTRDRYAAVLVDACYEVIGVQCASLGVVGFEVAGRGPPRVGPSA